MDNNHLNDLIKSVPLRHPRCSFRPRSLAAAEAGCPLDHCMCCGGHVGPDDHPCQQQLLRERHIAWQARCERELFELWWNRNWSTKDMPEYVRTIARQAFTYGHTGMHHEMHEYNLSVDGCGEDCPECHQMGRLED